ncbi:MAG: MBL fold metallo-hydrolase [Schlesneria sp.]
MVENLPYHSLQHDGLTIEGYSRAAVQSYWRIPELKLGFDLGGSPWDFMNIPTIFITHAHLDHMAALPVYVARRRMMKMEPPTIYLPEENVESADRLLKVWQKLDRGRMNCQLIGVKAGQEIELSRDHLVTVFATTHTVPSVGYLVWQRRKKLKPKYMTLSGNEIRDLRLSGEEVAHEVRTPLVCYTGDTSPPGIDNYPPIFDAKILITEITFFRPEHRKEKIYKFGHMHLDDIIERADKFHNELIIAMHFSTRYATNQIEKAVMKKIPAQLKDRIKLWL